MKRDLLSVAFRSIWAVSCELHGDDEICSVNEWSGQFNGGKNTFALVFYLI